MRNVDQRRSYADSPAAQNAEKPTGVEVCTGLANGWPIASGTVEGACKNLIRDRFERSGMRRTQETAEALLRLRATYLSGDFDNYWKFHANRDQQRPYPSWQVVLK